jgi:hypothetical protein
MPNAENSELNINVTYRPMTFYCKIVYNNTYHTISENSSTTLSHFIDRIIANFSNTHEAFDADVLEIIEMGQPTDELADAIIPRIGETLEQRFGLTYDSIGSIGLYIRSDRSRRA